MHATKSPTVSHYTALSLLLFLPTHRLSPPLPSRTISLLPPPTLARPTRPPLAPRRPAALVDAALGEVTRRVPPRGRRIGRGRVPRARARGGRPSPSTRLPATCALLLLLPRRAGRRSTLSRAHEPPRVLCAVVGWGHGRLPSSKSSPAQLYPAEKSLLRRHYGWSCSQHSALSWSISNK